MRELVRDPPRVPRDPGSPGKRMREVHLRLQCLCFFTPRVPLFSAFICVHLRFRCLCFFTPGTAFLCVLCALCGSMRVSESGALTAPAAVR